MDKVALKAIETTYNGYKFRSRLEARWAVFFDALDIKYFYEHEGFDLGNGVWYLPDFYLPEYNYWVEIKPHDRISDEEKTKHSLFIDHCESRWGGGEAEEFVIIYGSPGVPILYDDKSPYYAEFMMDYMYVWCECPCCGVVDMQFDGRSARNTHLDDCEILALRNKGESHPVYGRTDDKVYNTDSPRLVDAYNKAKETRF